MCKISLRDILRASERTSTLKRYLKSLYSAQHSKNSIFFFILLHISKEYTFKGLSLEVRGDREYTVLKREYTVLKILKREIHRSKTDLRGLDIRCLLDETSNENAILLI